MQKLKKAYLSTDEIPINLKQILPPHAQHIYMKAHNRALEEYKDPASRKYGGSLEEVVHKVAWNAVKLKYEKDKFTGLWKPLPGVKNDKFEEEYEEDTNV